MTRFLLESRKLMVGEEDQVAMGWELTFYNDVLGVVEKITASEDDTIVNAEPEQTTEAVKQTEVTTQNVFPDF